MDRGAKPFAIGEVDFLDVGQQDKPIGEGFPAVGAAHGGFVDVFHHQPFSHS